MRAFITAMLLAVSAWATPALARVEKIAVHSVSIEGNLEGNSADRTVYVILPPSYDSAKSRRFPVVYFLHGYLGSADRMMEYVPFDQALKGAGAGPQEMIIVVPDSNTRNGGSFYSNSLTVGNFEDFITRDLIGWIDGHYRSLARRESRGLAGHSMGGYGTLRLGMKHPDLFSSIYAMNPCCLRPRPVAMAKQEFETMTPEQVASADFFTRGNFAIAAAWSPNPAKPPFYADLITKDGKVDDSVVARWWANSPVAIAPQYLPALKGMTAIALDTGDTDFVQADVVAMHETLITLGVPHDWELYVGDHGNRVPTRFGEKVLPFFAKHLSAAAPGRKHR